MTVFYMLHTNSLAMQAGNNGIRTVHT